MTVPSISIVVETVTARERQPPIPLADAIAGTMEALASLDGHHDPEIVVVIDPTIAKGEAEAARQRFPEARFVDATRRNYFEAKTAGAAASHGEIVVWVDGDTVPDRAWLDMLVSRFEPGVDVVVGRTRYTNDSRLARVLSVPDFAQVVDAGGAASGFNINNVAFRRQILLTHSLDSRIRRNGGCYLLYNELRRAGVRMVYEPRASVGHALDGGLADFIHKQVDRGFDGITIYRIDDRQIIRGTPIFRRFGGLAVPALIARRLALDWVRLVKHRREMDVPLLAIPGYALVMLFTRMIQSVGAVIAVVDPHRYDG